MSQVLHQGEHLLLCLLPLRPTTSPDQVMTMQFDLLCAHQGDVDPVCIDLVVWSWQHMPAWQLLGYVVFA